MKLITPELEKIIPPLYAQEEAGDAAIVYAKFFLPWGNWTWYVLEYDPIRKECFGLVVGLDSELGYFNLDDLEEISGPGGLTIERDLYFTPKTIQEIRG